MKKIASLQTALVMSCAAVFTALQNEFLLGPGRNIPSTTLGNPWPECVYSLMYKGAMIKLLLQERQYSYSGVKTEEE